jgi:hypothetical protein
MSDLYESDIGSWFLAGKNPRGYDTGPGWLRSKQPNTQEFGTIMNQLRADVPPASAWLGKRLRFRAEVRVTDVNGSAWLWMRVDGAHVPPSHPPMLAFDNMQRRPIVKTVDWMPCEVVLDVSPEARQLCFGLGLGGDGEAWVRNATLEAVGPETPTTEYRAAVRNWIFEENLEPFLIALGWITGSDFGPEDWSAVAIGVQDTDEEADRWYDYPLADATRVAITRDPGSGVVHLRVDVPDWQHREVGLAFEIFGHFVVAGTKPRPRE